MSDEVRAAIERLWNTIPVGSGKDFNTVLKHMDRQNQRLDSFSVSGLDSSDEPVDKAIDQA